MEHRSSEENCPFFNQHGDEENTVPRDDEKAELWNAFFASAFNSQMGFLEDKQCPELAHKDGEQTRPETEEVVSDLCSHLDATKSGGLAQSPSGRLREPMEELAEPLSHPSLSSALASWGGPR